jgi:uncharacterized protein with von Willebrand factor type A (vWA) domain
METILSQNARVTDPQGRTLLDGVEVALCTIDGRDYYRIGQSLEYAPDVERHEHHLHLLGPEQTVHL